MRKLMKGAVVGVLGFGLALGVATQANAYPTYKPGEHAYDDTCKACHATDPNGTTTTPTTPTTPSTGTNGTTTTLPQTGAEGIYLNYLAGAGLLIPGAALLASRKKKH